MRRHVLFLPVAAMALPAGPVAAEVTASNESGFVSHHEAEIAVTPEEAWTAMLHPAGWWNAEHSYSGDAARLSLDPLAGGCFCEVVPGGEGSGNGAVEHMRVLYVDPTARTLRLSGGLGPLQAEAITAVLTMRIEPAEAGARIVWDYVVGGYARLPMGELARAVDSVMAEQLARLAAKLGRRQSSPRR